MIADATHRPETEDKYIGCRFGRWTVIGLAPYAGTKLQLSVRCDCGNERVVPVTNLTNGLSTQCARCGSMSAAKSIVAATTERRTGERLGSCVVLGRKGGRWMLRCDCGTEFSRTTLSRIAQCVSCANRSRQVMSRMTLQEAGDVLGVTREAVRVYLDRHGEDAVMARVDAVQRGEPDPARAPRAKAPPPQRPPKQRKYAAERDMIETLAPGTGFVWAHGLRAARAFARLSGPGVRSLVSGSTIWIVYTPDMGTRK